MRDTNIDAGHRVLCVRAVLTGGPATDQWDAMSLLRQFPEDARAFLPLLMETLQNDSARIRGKAAALLGHHGSAAREAVPRLRTLLNDEWSFVREAATNALQAIEAKEP